MATNAPRGIVDAIRRYDELVQRLALDLRPIVHDELTPCFEHIYEMKSGAALIYSATERPIADGICYIGLHSKHVTLGFMHGAELDDAEGILRGSGKVMRHIQIRAEKDLTQPELRHFLKQARALAGMAKKKPGARVDITQALKHKPRSASKAPRGAWPSKLF